MTSQIVTKQHDQFVESEVGDEIVLMHVENESFFRLSGTGRRIWSLLDAHGDAAGVASQLQAEYQVDAETCRTEVDRFLASLSAAGFVAVEPG